MSNTEERSWLEKYAPLGIHLAREVMVFVFCIVCAVGYSLGFVLDYISARNELYDWIDGKAYLIEGAKMPSFQVLMHGRMAGFIIVAIALVGIMIYHYSYHYMDSKIVYLMKRLPNKWELHKRCITLPIAGAVVVVGIMVLVWAIYLGVYLAFTPQQCLPF